MAKDVSRIQEAAEIKRCCKDHPHSFGLSPDTIDDFITWLYQRVDLPSFIRSTPQYKFNQFKNFVIDQIPNNGQLSLKL